MSSSTGVSELPHESMVDFAFASFTQSHGGPGRENGHIDRQLITGPNQLPVIELILQVYILSKMEAYLTYSRVASEITDSMTVFAPWDNSFNRLEESLVRKLRTRSWSAHLQNFIRFHMYDGYLAVDSLPNLPGSFNITMRNGEDIVVTQYPGGRIRVDGVRALASYDATDGFVYILDGVLLPAWLVRSLTDVASSTVSKFTSMIVRAGLEAELSDPNGSLTILAPTDDSFTKIDDILNKVLMQDEGLPILKELLEYHMLPNGPWPSSVFNQPRTFSTLQGENIRIIPGDLPVFQGNFNSASITLFDQVANNGRFAFLFFLWYSLARL